MDPLSDDVVYRVDGKDRIVFTNDAWDRFAFENESPHLSGERVRLWPLWEFVSDATTRNLYRKLIDAARAGRPSSFPLRCDSPGTRRLLRLSVLPGAAPGEVEFRSRAESVEPRPPERLLAVEEPRAGTLLRACAWCSRISVEDDWLEIEAAASRLALFQGRRLPPLSHGICPPCEARMERAIPCAGGAA